MKKTGLNVGYIGVGQCGGNIANEFAKLGYSAMAINTTMTDLEKLTDIIPKNKILAMAGNIQGAGKNPEMGELGLAENIDKIVSAVNTLFIAENVKIIRICVGFGGGTGTGMVTRLAEVLLDYADESGNLYFDSVGIIGTIPSDSESPRVRLIAEQGLMEVSKVEGLGSVELIDNNKMPVNEIGLKNRYASINRGIAKTFHRINSLTSVATEIAFDAMDLNALMSRSGYTMMTTVHADITTNAEEALIRQFKKQLEASPSVGTQLNPIAAGLIFEVPGRMMGKITENTINKILNEVNNPFEHFVGIYEKENTKDIFTTMHVVLAGLPYPSARIDEMGSRADNVATEFEQQLSDDMAKRLTMGTVRSHSGLMSRQQTRPVGQNRGIEAMKSRLNLRKI